MDGVFHLSSIPDGMGRRGRRQDARPELGMDDLRGRIKLVRPARIKAPYLGMSVQRF